MPIIHPKMGNTHLGKLARFLEKTIVFEMINKSPVLVFVNPKPAMIVILVIAAVAAGGIIATKIRANANNVPSP